MRNVPKKIKVENQKEGNFFPTQKANQKKKLFPHFSCLHNFFLFLFFLGIFLFPPSNHANSPGWVEHINPGCPLNSLCGPETGKLRLQWLDLIKSLQTLDSKKINSPKTIDQLENFRKTYGLPISIWSKFSSYQNLPTILWDSPCPHHQNADSKRATFLGEVFAIDSFNQKITLGPLSPKEGKKDLKGEIPEEQIFLDLFLLQEMTSEESPKENPSKPKTSPSSSILSFYGPQGEIPALVKKKDLYFLRDFEGIYYSLKITPQGNWQIVKALTSNSLEGEISCPSALKEHFLKATQKSTLYSSFHCKKIKDDLLKKTYILLLPLSC